MPTISTYSSSLRPPFPWPLHRSPQEVLGRDGQLCDRSRRSPPAVRRAPQLAVSSVFLRARVKHALRTSLAIAGAARRCPRCGVGQLISCRMNRSNVRTGIANRREGPFSWSPCGCPIITRYSRARDRWIGHRITRLLRHSKDGLFRIAARRIARVPVPGCWVPAKRAAGQQGRYGRRPGRCGQGYEASDQPAAVPDFPSCWFEYSSTPAPPHRRPRGKACPRCVT